MSVLLGVGPPSDGYREFDLLAERGWDVAVVADELGGLRAIASKPEITIEVDGADTVAGLALPLTLLAFRHDRGALEW